MSNINNVLNKLVQLNESITQKLDEKAEKTQLANKVNKLSLFNSFSLTDENLRFQVEKLIKILGGSTNITIPDDPSAAMNIHNLTELQQFAKNVTLSGKTYDKQKINLCNDIDCSTWTNFTGIGGHLNDPVTTKFRGIFNGNGRTIKNLTINITNKGGGFFNTVWMNSQQKDAEINDLNMDNIKILNPNKYAYIGTLVGHCSTCIKISNCHITNTELNGRNQIAGIAGAQYIDIENSSFQGKIKSIGGYWGIGGITGNHCCYRDNGIKNCIVDAEIEIMQVTQEYLKDLAVGGLVGTICGDNKQPQELVVKNNKVNCKITINGNAMIDFPIIGTLNKTYNTEHPFDLSKLKINNSNYWSKETSTLAKYQLYWQSENDGNFQVLVNNNPVQIQNAKL